MSLSEISFADQIYALTRAQFPSKEIINNLTASFERCGIPSCDLVWIDQKGCNFCWKCVEFNEMFNKNLRKHFRVASDTKSWVNVVRWTCHDRKTSEFKFYFQEFQCTINRGVANKYWFIKQRYSLIFSIVSPCSHHLRVSLPSEFGPSHSS